MSGRVERIQVLCFGCGKSLEKYPSQVAQNKTGRFVCPDCRGTVGTKPRTVPRRQCEWCGDEFVSYKGDTGRFCKKECYDAWQRRNRVQRVCEWCGSTFERPPSWGTRQAARFCKRACEAEAKIRRPLDRQHNGRPAAVDKMGYVRVYEPEHAKATKSGWVFEHRLIAEQELGRHLRRDEHVHHVNGVKHDNRPENLLVMAHGEHSTLTGLANGQRLREWEEYRKRFGPLEGER